MLEKLKKQENFEDDYKVINNIKGLSIDMIHEANSGHPGICLGAATILYTLYSRHLNINPEDPNWFNRDRFVMSAGHGAPLLYSILYMLDYITLDDCKKLRKLGSVTPGHPEITTGGVDFSTGPLGQGVASAVGMAIAERYLNTINKQAFNHYTYALVGDGCLMEGISYEALAIAGKLNLNKLIVLYDSNNVTLDSELSKSTEEDIIARFRSINFNILTVVDGDSIQEIDNAIKRAKESNKPSIIICKTKIGKGSKLEGKNSVHGKPLEDDDIKQLKKKLGLIEAEFNIVSESKDYFKNKVMDRIKSVYQNYQRSFDNIKEIEEIRINRIINDSLVEPEKFDVEYEDKSLRDINALILNELAKEEERIIGGSADLSSSTKTYLKDMKDFSSKDYSGRNIYFGIREHAMGAIANGMAIHGLKPFVSTFLVFSDYLRPSIRMSALMNLPVLYTFTHDSITVGEDGKTHEPIEQLYSLELIPNLTCYQPYDINELISCYKDIYKENKPVCLVLPRDSKNITELTKANQVEMGGYILKKEETDDYITIVSSGESLKDCIDLDKDLKAQGIDYRIVSIPCYKNLLKQSKEYQNSLFTGKEVIAYTYGIKDKFYPITKNVLGMDTFGESGSKESVLDYFNLTKDGLLNYIENLLNPSEIEENNEENN